MNWYYRQPVKQSIRSFNSVQYKPKDKTHFSRNGRKLERERRWHNVYKVTLVESYEPSGPLLPELITVSASD